MNQDWHQADIIAAIRKKGTTLAAVSRGAGLSSSTLSNALTRKWPKGEKLIAEAIGVNPELIWPSRYRNLFNELMHGMNVWSEMNQGKLTLKTHVATHDKT